VNLEEMLLRERDRPAPNPLMHRTGEIIARVRRRRRARAAVGGVASAATVAAVAVVGWQVFAPGPLHESAPTSPIAGGSDAVPLSQVPADSPLDPGRYVASVMDSPSAPLLPVLSVPEGYTGLGGASGVVAEDFDDDNVDEAYLWVWGNVTEVYTHPCDTGAFSDPVGPSVADLANALAAQPLVAGTDPVPVTVGGYDGLYLELSAPDDFDFSACPQEALALWAGRFQQYPGQVDMVWIVDVEGERIVFDASHKDASPEQVAELTEMVTTATFTPAEGT